VPEERARRRRHRREPVSAAQALARFRRRAGGGSSEAGAAALAWPDVVGAGAAGHSVPVRRTRAGVLTVACSSAAWAHELTSRRDELAARLRERCPEAGVVALRFTVADHVLPAPSAPGGAPSAPVAPSPAQRVEGSRAAQGVDDPRLRALVERAAAASAARRDGPPRR